MYRHLLGRSIACAATALALAAAPLALRPAHAAYMGQAPLLVQSGGTGATTFTAHGVIIGEGTSALVALTPAADSIPLWQSATADPTVTAINGCSTATSALTYNTSTHAFGCNTISGGSWTTVAESGSATLASTNQLVALVSDSAAATITLGTAANGLVQCVKDSAGNANSNHITVQGTTPATNTIDGQTSFVLNQNYEQACFVSNGTVWYVGL